jgi:hypothetical protein
VFLAVGPRLRRRPRSENSRRWHFFKSHDIFVCRGVRGDANNQPTPSLATLGNYPLAITGQLPKNNSLRALKSETFGCLESVTCDPGRNGVSGQPAPKASWPRLSKFRTGLLSTGSNRDHFLQADFPLLIVVSERKITSECPTICAKLGQLLFP